MDVDLSIDLDAFTPLVASVMSGHSDIAIGTRYAQASYVDRAARRAFFSRSLNYLLRLSLGARFSDAMCGFKAARRAVIQDLLPYVHDNRWFFDPELLLQAQRRGLRIHEVPVVCIDDPDSSVHVLRDARDDLVAMVRMARRLAGGVPSARFATIWALCTVLYAGLVAALHNELSTVGASALALVLAAAANTAALRLSSVGVRAAAAVIRYQLLVWVDWVVRLVLTTAVAVLFPGEIAPVFVAVALASVISYLLLRGRNPATQLVRRDWERRGRRNRRDVARAAG
jgi:hypothetical protein